MLERIDWKKVTEEIKDNSSLTFDDLEDCISCVYVLSAKYLEKDLKKYKLIGVEIPFSDGKEELPFKGTVDVLLKDINNNDLIIIDWKSTSKEDLDTQWAQNYKLSWQWKLYSSFFNVNKFLYRGVSRLSGNIREVEININDLLSLKEETQTYLDGERAQIASIRSYSRFPRIMPNACGLYGKLCPNFDSCVLDKNKAFVPKIDELHYTTLEIFNRCPELFRIEVDNKYNSASEDFATDFGSSLHRGIAEVYKQAFYLKDK